MVRTQSEITFNSLTSMTVHAPNRTVATIDRIHVETVHGRSPRSLRYGRANAPAIHSVTPDTGDKGGGNKVVIKGLQFVNGSHQLTEVEFGRGNKAKILAVSDTELIVEAPAGNVGTVDVIVYNHRAWHDSDASGIEIGAYTYTDDPVITEIDPFYVPWSGPWPPVTIRGRNFPETRMGVKFGGNLIWWTNLTWKSSTELEVTPPAPWTGDPIDVVVFAEHKKDSNKVKFHYYHSHPGSRKSARPRVRSPEAIV